MSKYHANSLYMGFTFPLNANTLENTYENKANFNKTLRKSKKGLVRTGNEKYQPVNGTGNVIQ